MIQSRNWYRPIAETGDFIVVDKAAGANLHRNQQTQSLLDVLKKDYRCEQLYLVHRLDDATSGLLLLAKSAETAAALGAEFAERRVDKYYLAAARGRPGKKQGAVIGDMQKSRNGSYRLCRSRENPAISYFFTSPMAPGLRLYLLKPATGKTHQLRVAMKSLGVAICGDTRYRGAPAGRCHLHHYALRFRCAGVDYCYVCPPSDGEYFAGDGYQQALIKWTQPWLLSWPVSAQHTLPVQAE